MRSSSLECLDRTKRGSDLRWTDFIAYSVPNNQEQTTVILNLKAPPAERGLDRRPCVPPDGQEEQNVDYDEYRRVDGATG